ncbi:hypothetical protein LZ30DRAFT_2289 [Colletotrichum cereale]|nr:hypothetical protein LZ30DRAFT_2289 [Colletotrichum cereale]
MDGLYPWLLPVHRQRRSRIAKPVLFTIFPEDSLFLISDDPNHGRFVVEPKALPPGCRHLRPGRANSHLAPCFSHLPISSRGGYPSIFIPPGREFDYILLRGGPSLFGRMDATYFSNTIVSSAAAGEEALEFSVIARALVSPTYCSAPGSQACGCPSSPTRQDTILLSDCQTVRLSDCQTVRLSDCQTVRLSLKKTPCSYPLVPLAQFAPRGAISNNGIPPLKFRPVLPMPPTYSVEAIYCRP